jgi:hypothetical protein
MMQQGVQQAAMVRVLALQMVQMIAGGHHVVEVGAGVLVQGLAGDAGAATQGPGELLTADCNLLCVWLLCGSLVLQSLLLRARRQLC